VEYVYRQLVICVRKPSEIAEFFVTPGTERALIYRMNERGWTAFAQDEPFRMRVVGMLTDTTR
jgi:hypothetical protein